MDQPNPSYSFDDEPRGPAAGEKAVSPTLVFSIIWRRKFGIGFTACVLCGAVIAALSTIKPSYIATASVLMEDHKPVVAEILSPSGTSASDSVAVRTQVDVLKSVDLARNVVRKLDLLNRPEFDPPADGPSLTRRLLDAIRPYDTARLLERAGLFTPPPEPSLEERMEVATQALLGMTSIVNDGHSYVIDIRVKVPAGPGVAPARAAALSAEIANAYADVYTQFTSKVKADTMRQVNGFFDERIASLRQRMRGADEAVQAYRAATGLVEDRAAAGGASVTIAGQQMAQLNGDLINATADRANKEASLQQITLARAGRGDLQSISEIVASPLIQHLREQQAQLGAKAAALSTSQGAGSPELIAVRGALRGVETQIAAETAKIANSLRTAVDSARAREAALRAQLARLQTEVGSQGEAEIKLHELQNDADIARTIYLTYLKRSEETATQVDIQEPDALVVSRAGIPLHPAPPSKAALGGAGCAVAVAVAVLLGLLRERMQSGFRSGEQLEASVGVETLGFVPKVRNPRAALGFEDQHSTFTQAIFSIRALLKLGMKPGSRVVMVTSALPQEGKTFLSASLARNAAIAGERVLLIDCDLRRPTVARNIVTTESDTLVDVTIRRDGFSSLDIITLSTGQGSPQDLFASSKMHNLIAKLRERYDLILLDTPPVLAVSDARVLARLADLTVLVVCWKKTPQALVAAAAAALRNSGAKLAGAVITQVKFSELSPADGGQAYVYHNYAKYLPAQESA
jgi:capsular exopolysaccharide synthesis family protein